MKQGDVNALDIELLSQNVSGGGNEELQLLRNLVLAIRRNILRVLLGAVVAAVIAVGLTFTVTEKYTSTALVMLDTRVNADPEYTPVVSGLPTTLTSLESELEVLRSTDLIERVVVNLDLVNAPEFADSDESGFSLSPRALIGKLRGLRASPADTGEANEIDIALEETIKRVADSRTVEQIGTSSAVFAIRMTATNRFQAANIANALANEYLDTQTLEKIRSLERSQGWLTARTQQLQVTINDLVSLLETHLIESPFSAEEYATLKAQRQIAERQLKSEEEKLSSLTNTISEIQAYVDDNQLVAAAQALPDPSDRLTAALSLSEGSSTPELENILSEEISASLGRLSQSAEAAVGNLEATRSRIEELKADQTLQAEHDGETRRIENEITVSEAIYKDFVSQLSRRTEQNEYLDSDGRIIEFARPATSASEPRRSMTGGLVFVLASLFGFATVLLREIYHNRLRTVREIEETTGLPLLCFLPDIGKNIDLIGKLIQGQASTEPTLMQFARKLRVSLNNDLPAPSPAKSKGANTGDQKPAGAAVIAGTSASPGEGLSSSLLLLAVAFAEAGEKVLLLDCDFWQSAYADISKGSIIDLTKIEARPRLVDNLIVPTETSGLQLLPALVNRDTDSQATDIAGFFNSRAFEVLLKHLGKDFDRIIIDTPPLLPVVDAVSILTHADQVVYFLRWNMTPVGAVENAKRILEDVNAKAAYTVATRVRLDQISKYGDTSLSYINKALKSGY